MPFKINKDSLSNFPLCDEDDHNHQIEMLLQRHEDVHKPLNMHLFSYRYDYSEMKAYFIEYGELPHNTLLEMQYE